MTNKLFAFVLFVFASYSFFVSSGVSGNATRTAALTWSIVNHGVLNIDAYQNVTVDKALYEGHYFVAGEPGLSFLGVPIHFLYMRVRDFAGIRAEAGFPPDFFSMYLLRVFLISLPSSLVLVLFYNFLIHFSMPDRERFKFLILYAFASPAFAYSTLFYRHQLSAVITFYIFYLFFTMKKYGYQNHRFFLAGLLASLDFFCDYASLIPNVILLSYFLKSTGSWKRLLFYCAGSAPFLVCFLSYNFVCFGNIFLSGNYYSLITSEEIGGRNIFQLFLSFWRSDAAALYGITFSSYRGLFFFFPLSLIPFVCLKHLSRYHEFRVEIFMLFMLFFVQVYFVSSLWDWMGALGLISRHLVIVLPFLILLIALSYNCYPILSCVFFLCSFCAALLVCVSPYGEVPGEITSPLSFVIQTAENGFFRENILSMFHVPARISTVLYIAFVTSGILVFLKVKDRNASYS